MIDLLIPKTMVIHQDCIGLNILYCRKQNDWPKQCCYMKGPLLKTALISLYWKKHHLTHFFLNFIHRLLLNFTIQTSSQKNTDYIEITFKRFLSVIVPYNVHVQMYVMTRIWLDNENTANIKCSLKLWSSNWSYQYSKLNSYTTEM